MSTIANLMVGLGVDVSNLESGMQRARQTVKDASEKMASGMDGAKQAMDGANKSTRDMSNGLSGMQGSAATAMGSIKGIAVSLGLLAVAAGVVSMAKAGLDKAFNRMDTMDQFKRTMTAITGNTESAGIALDELKGITKGTAYGLDVAAKATQDFVTRGMDIGAATKSVGIWADAVSFYGKGTSEELSNVGDALAKMRTKGTVEMDQLNRLFDSGIDAVGMYAKTMGKSSSEVQDALSKGEISADDFLNTVEEAMRTGADGVIKVAGAAKEAGTSWQGTFDNMGAAAARGMEALVTAVDGALTANGLPTLKQMVADVGTNFETTAKNISAWIAGLQPDFEIFKSAFGEKSAAIKQSTDDMTTAWANLWIEFEKDTGGMKESDFWAFIGSQAAQTVIDFNTMAASIANAGTWIMDTWNGMTSGIVYMWTLATTAFNAIASGATWLAESFSISNQAMTNVNIGFGTSVQTVLTQTDAFFQWFGAQTQGITDWFNAVWNNAALTMQNCGSTITNALNGAGDWWISQFNGFIAWITNLPNEVYQYGVNVVTMLGQGITDAASRATDAVWTLVNDVKKKFLEGFGIKSPSSFITDVVNNLMNTFADNIDGSNIVTFVENLVTQIKAAFSGGNFNIAKALSWLGNGAKDVLKSMGINLPSLMGLLFPTDATNITSGFGNRDSPGGIGSTNHQGIDIGAAYGDIVRAVGDGMVTWAGDAGDGYGNSIWMDLGNGLQTLFGHLSSIDVYQGDYVKAGQEVGNVGSTGNSTGPHLHYGVYENGVAIDPQGANIGSSGGDLGSWIMQAMNAMGVGSNNYQHLYDLAMAESGGDPLAQNNWDSNAMAGIPSKGLMQTIQSTFDAYSQGGSVWDPISNIKAAIGYMLDRYGSIENTPLTGYAVGTRYVPRDMTARIHEGEMITPKKDNPYANGKKESVKPIVVQLFLNGKAIAEAAIDDINDLQASSFDLAMRGV